MPRSRARSHSLGQEIVLDIERRLFFCEICAQMRSWSAVVSAFFTGLMLVMSPLRMEDVVCPVGFLQEFALLYNDRTW